jgi:hypothetical protein
MSNSDGIYRLKAPTWKMNPRVSRGFLDRERKRDPELFAQEYGAEFVAGGGAFLSLQAIQGAIGIPQHTHGRRVLALDPAFYRDSFAIALVCKAGDQFHVEHVETWEPPVGFGEAMDGVAALAKRFGPEEVVTDQFAAAAIVDELRRRGVRCKSLPWTAQNKSEAFSLMKASLNTGRLWLVDDQRLLKELSNLVATPTALGFGIEGGNDDLAVAGVLALWRLRTHTPGRMLRPIPIPGPGSYRRSGALRRYIETDRGWPSLM